MHLIVLRIAAVVASIAVTCVGDATFPSLRTPQLDKRFNHNRIVWCKQSRESPPYDLSSGANCEKYNTATLIANPASYDEFRKVFCRLKRYSQLIKFKHVQRIRYGSKKYPNLAYNTLKWSLVNLRPDPEQLWLEFGVAHGFSANLTAYIKERVLHSSSPVYGFDWFRGLPEDW